MTINRQRKEGLSAHQLIQAMRWPLIVTAINIAAASVLVLFLILIGQLPSNAAGVSLWGWMFGLGVALGALNLARDRLWDEFAILTITAAVILLVGWRLAEPLISAAICMQGCIIPDPS